MLQHPNIVSVHDVFEDRSSVHVVMELCSGGDLADYLSFLCRDDTSADHHSGDLSAGCSERDAAGIIRSVLQVGATLWVLCCCTAASSAVS